MISITKVGGTDYDKTTEIKGLSTDTKPTEDIHNGDVFLEIDTGNVYFYDGDSHTWITP